MNRWKRRVQALTRLAEDQRGKPEGDVARQKLLYILNKYPEARDYEPVKELVRKDITLRDIGYMRRNNISTAGSWTGGNLQQAIKLMEADYRQRIERHKRPKLQPGALSLSHTRGIHPITNKPIKARWNGEEWIRLD
jgi:hypothetical protein